MKNPYQNLWGTGNVGEGTRVAAFVDIGGKVGKNCIVGAFSFIPPGVEIEDDVFIAPHVCFTNDKKPKMGQDWIILKTIVKKGASIGANTTILPGIIIGEGSMIGAGSVVTKDVEPNTIVFGNPARFYKKI